MHRAENTISENTIVPVISAFDQLSELQIVFPLHPRTESVLKKLNLYDRLAKCKNVKLIKPLGYIDFIKLMQNATKIITDSGGIQKEAYLLSVPCITIRKNTEWVETVNAGWNLITDTDSDKIVNAARNWNPTERPKPIFGDGTTSNRIKEELTRAN
jgi:UDP-N-acetylglucosamine 2-epimerase (non-hydrolysing)